METVGSTVASACNSKHLADTAERTNLELTGKDVLTGPAELLSGRNGRVPSNTPTKLAQGRCRFDISSENWGLWNCADCSEMNRSESLYFERRWRWPLSYRAIEVLAIFVDTLIIIAAGVLADAAYSLTITALPTGITIYGGAAAVVAALSTCLLKERGLYKPTALLNWTAQVRAVIITWIGVFMFLAGCVFALKIGDTFSRITIISFAAVGLCGLIAQRMFWRTILEGGLANGKLSGRTIVLISESQPGPSLQQVLLRHGFRVRRHFVVSADRSHPSHWDDVISEAVSYVRQSNVDELFIAADLQNWAKLREMTERLRLLPLPVNLIVVGLTSELLKRPLSAIGNATVIELQRAPLNFFELSSKRIVDIFLAGTTLIALLPLLATVAIAIKLDSPGNIIFRQTRHGFNGKPFQILKFRTMTVLEDGESVKQAERFDKRVTRLGWWLRRTSIDELPQLINVLKGEMSIVGPRPHAAVHDNHFDKIIANYAFRQRMKPGITGCAQVNGSRGETPTTKAMQRRVELDIWYIDNWSFQLDLAIMFRTTIEIVRGRNAY
jgi:Undecaprenyl-phosphate glucose phosphotransferase